VAGRCSLVLQDNKIRAYYIYLNV